MFLQNQDAIRQGFTWCWRVLWKPRRKALSNCLRSGSKLNLLQVVTADVVLTARAVLFDRYQMSRRKILRWYSSAAAFSGSQIL
jgi:hypothetical protein